MSRRAKEAASQAQLDRIEAKLDEVLAFRDQLNTRIEGLLGKSEGLLSGPLMATLMSGLRSGASRAPGAVTGETKSA